MLSARFVVDEVTSPWFVVDEVTSPWFVVDEVTSPWFVVDEVTSPWFVVDEVTSPFGSVCVSDSLARPLQTIVSGKSDQCLVLATFLLVLGPLHATAGIGLAALRDQLVKALHPIRSTIETGR